MKEERGKIIHGKQGKRSSHTAAFSRFLMIFVMFVILMGCSTKNSVTESNSIPTQLSQSIAEGENLEQLPTVTARPSSTPLPSATANQTQTAIFQSNSSTHFAEQTRIAQYPRICTDRYAPLQYSPDKFWLEELCYSEADQDLILTLSNKATQVLWKLNYRDYVDFMPDGGMSVVYWSNDGRYAYFNSYLATSGGYCYMSGNVLNHGTGLFRLDLDTGNTNAILPWKENSAGYSFSFSPTGRRLVYEAFSLGVKVLDLKSGQVINISSAAEFSEVGGYLWSADGLQVVYSTVLSVVDGMGNYSIRIADSQSGTERILLESTEDCFAARAWTEDNIITIESYDKNYNRTLIEYDLNSKKIIREATATPRP